MVPGLPGVGLTRRDIEGDAYSVSAHASYPVWEKLEVSAGVRYDHEKREFKDYMTGLALDGTWEEVSPKIALEHRHCDIYGYAQNLFDEKYDQEN